MSRPPAVPAVRAELGLSRLAVGESSVILLAPPLHPYWNACQRERGLQRDDGPADGWSRHDAPSLPTRIRSSASAALAFCSQQTRGDHGHMFAAQSTFAAWTVSSPAARCAASRSAAVSRASPSRRRDCHSAAPPSTLGRCLNSDGESAPANWQSRRRRASPARARARPPRAGGARSRAPFCKHKPEVIRAIWCSGSASRRNPR